MRRITFCPVALAVFAAHAAAAATIPAEYVVQAKPLKAAVATDTVNASLYSDSACTALVATTGDIALQNVELSETLKPFKPKSATIKPPGIVRMHFTFSASPPAGDLFLSVSSSAASAIVGFPTACQPQAPIADAKQQICQELAGTPNCNLASTIRTLANASIKLFAVTNTTPGGSFGNRAATTATCAAAAVSQGLTCGSTIALLAYTGDDIASMPTNHGVGAGLPIEVAGTGAPIASDWSDFMDGSWLTCVGGFCDPSGPTPGGLSGSFYFTGANNDGTVNPVENCFDWSSTTGFFSTASANCYGASGIGCSAGQTFASGTCNDPACCNVTQGSILCLCY